jgi:hypothetical protein
MLKTCATHCGRIHWEYMARLYGMLLQELQHLSAIHLLAKA